MGKNYVENSLKRFLKRKVKITLGVVVTFLITGMVAFAEGEKPKNVGDHNKNFEGITNAKDNLTGINNSEQKFNDFTTEKEITINKHKYFVKMENNTLSFRKESETASAINSMTIESKDISNALKEKIDDILANLENSDTSNSNVNNSILASTQTGNVTNNGIINSGANAAQIANSGNKIINNGIINTSGYYTQYSASGSSNATIINNGLIYANGGVAQYGFATNEKVELINTGIIKAQNNGQIITGKSSKAMNYGIIEVIGNYAAQQCGTKTDNVLLNYGIINAYSGQSILGITNEAYNYGFINGKIGISASSEAKGYNYRVIKVADAINAFKGDVTNKGIVIVDKGELTAQYNTGILLDSEYNVRGEDTKVFKSGETVTDFGGTNSFGENITKGYVKDTSVNIDNTQGKVIGAVVTDSSKLTNGAVFNYTGTNEDGLFLKDTTITGYFKDNGVLLNAEDKKLILGGDTNITAVKGDLSLDVYAVNIGKGQITIMDEAKINGLIKGENNSTITFANSKGEYQVSGDKVEVNIADGGKGYENYFDVTLTGTTSGVNNSKVNEVEVSTKNAIGGLTNKLVIGKDLTVGKNAEGNSIYDTNTTNKDAELELTIENIHNIEGNISLGVGKDKVIVTNNDNHTVEHLKTEINLGEGEDEFVVVGNATDAEGNSKNIFSYNVVNAETIELQGGTWGDWSDAKGTIKFEGNKAGNKPILRLGNDTTMHITLNAEKDHESDFADYVANDLKLSHAVITGTGNKAVAKYQIDETNGLDTGKLSTTKYSFGEGVSYKDSPIFNISSEEGKGVNISLKTAADLGLSGQQRVIYDAYIKQIIADGSVNKGVINKINNMNNQNDMVNLIKKTDVNGRAYYTAGSVVTKDIVNSYVSSVEEFKPRAEKGQWLAQGKYINSDTEFDGGSKVKGYDGDITGTVGMIEYGFTDNTSYGAVFGQGDAEMDINGGGKLDGDNIYAGLYMKHRTANGIELVGNIGYVKSDMDSDLRNDFTTNYADKDGKVSIGGSTTEKGTADSSAVILSLKGRKDYKITDTVKVQPIFGARATFINQEKAENPEMNFTVAEQDIIVLEGTAGMGIAKEFALPQGILELNAGAEYTFAATSSNNDAEYTLFEGDYQATHIKMDDVDAAENTGTVFVGADYEHENGVGFNAKYEMMWSDKGDDLRVTAGISYRF